jgi:subtilisin-like proprotein convertase family protein
MHCYYRFGIVYVIRPDLNWRDVQRLTVETAVIVNPTDEDWKQNGANRKFNHKYGYGTFDAYKLIEAAREYRTVGEQVVLKMESEWLNRTIPFKQEGVRDSFIVTEELIRTHGLSRLEHVVVSVNITHERRGDVEIYLTSPFGMVSRLIETRMFDEANTGFPNWEMSSNAHWDEPILGAWTIQVMDIDHQDKTGTLHHWTLKLWGERMVPLNDVPSAIPSNIPIISTTHKVEPTLIPTPSHGPVETPTNSSVPGLGSGVIHSINNVPTLLVLFFVFSSIIIVSFSAHRLGWFRRRHAEAQQFKRLDNFDDEDFDVLALEDLERGGEADWLVNQ